MALTTVSCRSMRAAWVTDAVLEEVRDWQNRPLDGVYPVVFFDALRVKIRDEGLVRNKEVYLALAIVCQGEKEVLGLWIEQTEGAKFWLKVMNDLKTRGVGDILIAVVDGLTGFPDAIAAVFPKAAVQTCIVGLLKKPWLCDSVPQYLVFDLRCWITRTPISWSCSSRARFGSWCRKITSWHGSTAFSISVGCARKWRSAIAPTTAGRGSIRRRRCD